jgi:hypothetical protein
MLENSENQRQQQHKNNNGEDRFLPGAARW